MNELNKDGLLGLGKSDKPQRVDLPGGSCAYVRVMGTEERDQFEELVFSGKTRGSYRTWLLVKCVCDAAGARLFVDADYPAVSKLPVTITEPIMVRAQRINRLTKADVDELVGNSGSGTSAASGSSSPATSTEASENANEPLAQRSSRNGSRSTGSARLAKSGPTGETPG